MLDAKALLPCPFCGGIVSVETEPRLRMFGIKHDADCFVGGGGEFVWDTESEAITAWNTRAPTLATEHAALTAEVARLREALTPSGDTKAAYMGEFQFNLPVGTMEREDGSEEFCINAYVPWTTIKEVMAAIVARAALEGQSNG